MRNIYAAIGVVVVILSIIIFAFVRSRLPQTTKQAGVNTTPTITPIVEGQATISTSTVIPSKTVVVDSVTIDKPGFLVVSENSNGQPGTVLGSSDLLTPGKHDNVVVTVSRKTNDGENLLVSFYKDNGDGKFDPSNDQVLKNSAGLTLVSTMKVANTQGQPVIPATGLGEDDL